MDSGTLQNLVSTLLQLLGTETESVSVALARPGQPGRTVVAVTLPAGDDAKNIIGPHGEHLRALNALARRLVEAKHGEEAAAFLIDINRYHEEKMDAVRANANMLAQRARLFKHDVEMNPMSPYERLVVHELFSDDPDIQTESHGEGKFRHIVLKYKNSA